MKKFLMIALGTLMLFSSIFAATPFSQNGKLSVSGNYLVNSCGTQIQLRGVASHGLQYYPNCHPTAALDYALSMGSDVYRISMYVDENGYMTDPTGYTNQVDTLVDQVGARGMYAIIDWHILTPGDPNTTAHRNAAQTFFVHEANLHKDKDWVIYEICNEPNGVTWLGSVKPYADWLIPQIRAIDPDAIIIVGTPTWSQLGADVVNNKLSYTNIMYTFHFYAASHSTNLLTPYAGQLPIFVTEWAASTSSGGGTLDTGNADAFHTIMNNNKISWTTWSFSDAPESSAMFNSGTCSSGVYNDTKLSTEGNYVRGKIQSPADNFGSCGSNSPVPTSTRTRTSTPSRTQTPAITFTRTATRTATMTATRTRTTGPSPSFTPTFTITRTRTASPTITLTPAPSTVAVPCGQGITIDGGITDAAWQTGSWIQFNRLATGTNPQGASAQFKVRWDSEAMYVAIDVTDSTLFNDSGANWYDDSSVEVYLDMNHNASGTYGADDFQFSMRYNDAVLREQNNKQGTATGAVAARAGGYIVEMRLPWTVLGVTPSESAIYGFDVGVNVDSGGGAREGVLMWAGTSNNYTDTSAFGDAVLGAACPVNTPTFTFTRTATRTITPVNTYTRTATRTATATVSSTESRVPSATFTATRTNTPVNTFTRTATRTNTPVNTFTYTRTRTNTPVNTSTSSVVPTFTRTVSATNTPVNTYTRTATRTATSTLTLTSNPSPSFTRTVTGTYTRTFTRTNTPVYSPTETWTGTPPTDTVTPTVTITFTVTSTESLVPSSTQTATATVTVTSTVVQSPTFTRTATPGNTLTNTPVNTVTDTPVNTPVNTAVDTFTMTTTLTATPTLTLTSNPSPSFTRTATRTATPVATSTMTVTSVPTEIPTPTPEMFEILEPLVFPNPFKPGSGNDAGFSFDLTQDAASLHIKIYTTGLRAVIAEDWAGGPAGRTQRVIEGYRFSGLAAGVYYYMITGNSAGDAVAKSKPGVIVILK